MAKTATQFLCSECGDTFAKWFGKCPSCQEWNTLKEFREAKISGTKTNPSTIGTDLKTKPRIHSVPQNLQVKRISTLIDEVDRVLGEGFFPGSMILFGGSPGIGKSTLSLQIFINLIQAKKHQAFYFSGEESQEQIIHRAERLSSSVSQDIKNNIFSTNALEDILHTTQTHNPDIIVIDSIQMIGLEHNLAGSMTQLRTNAEILLKLAKQTNTTILIIGHVTKDNEIAGPKVLEHIVDTVIHLEGEKNSDIRLLRSSKNRFGSTLEVGVFEMRPEGLKTLKNPSEFFLSERSSNTCGSAITVTREGSRNFVTEIQALTVKTNFGLPRRTSHGIDLSKLHLLLAVISKFTPFPCENFDAYLNVTSGLKLKEPACDLAIIAAILSSRCEKEIPPSILFLGEVGLSGEIRSVSNLEQRLNEAAKLGFQKAIIPKVKNIPSIKDIHLKSIKHISELIKELFQKS